MKELVQAIESGRTSLGIELGSTRIKAVLIGEDHQPLASGGHDWENRLENGVWTYDLKDVWTGLQEAYAKLAAEVQAKYGVVLTRVGSLGISAMMHGYLVFGGDGAQLVPFRTWRNTMTEEAATDLTNRFQFNIPQRWSIAHLYQALLNGEDHVKDIAFMTTLAGYVHWQLTGEKVLGVGEASGMFPIDSTVRDFDAKMLAQMDALLAERGIGWKLKDNLPRVLNAGDAGGALSPEGAKRLDPSGALQSGIPLCPPEGDAGTGMVATNSVAERTGNVSAGTSIFAMVVLEKALSALYPEIDMVTTPAGSPVAMVHCNNCSTDLDAWVKLFGETLALFGAEVEPDRLYGALYNKALEGEADAGGLLSFNYYSGEHIVHLDQGRPLFTRLPDSKLNVANFMRSLIFASMASLKIGMDILTEKEHVRLTQLLGHGGIFRTKGVAQRLMAGALNVPVVVMDSAGEGGAWGIALLAAYMREKDADQTLDEFLHGVFAGDGGTSIQPVEADRMGFEVYMERFQKGLPIERAAVETLVQRE